jgi:hypothetical protein
MKTAIENLRAAHADVKIELSTLNRVSEEKKGTDQYDLSMNIALESMYTKILSDISSAIRQCEVLDKHLY